MMGLLFKTVAYSNSSEQDIDFGVVEILAVHTSMEPHTDVREKNNNNNKVQAS